MTTKQWEIRIGQDHNAESPNDWGLFKVVSFNNRHNAFLDPDTIDESEVLCWLSYYEHGLCRWSVGQARPTGGWSDWDTVGIAGAIVFQDEVSPHQIAWFKALTDEERQKTLESVAETWTDWSNGSVYHYDFYEVIEATTCSNCGHKATRPEADVNEDSCGGFIGDALLVEGIKEVFASFEVQLGTVGVLGDFEYIIDQLPEIK